MASSLVGGLILHGIINLFPTTPSIVWWTIWWLAEAARINLTLLLIGATGTEFVSSCCVATSAKLSHERDDREKRVVEIRHKRVVYDEYMTFIDAEEYIVNIIYIYIVWIWGCHSRHRSNDCLWVLLWVLCRVYLHNKIQLLCKFAAVASRTASRNDYQSIE